MVINQTGNYLLYGVVKYFEYNYFSSGYFAAYCRSPIDNCWYFYNDEYVKPINENEKIEIQEKGVTITLGHESFFGLSIDNLKLILKENYK